MSSNLILLFPLLFNNFLRRPILYLKIPLIMKCIMHQEVQRCIIPPRFQHKDFQLNGCSRIPEFTQSKGSLDKHKASNPYSMRASKGKILHLQSTKNPRELGNECFFPSIREFKLIVQDYVEYKPFHVFLPHFLEYV